MTIEPLSPGVFVVTAGGRRRLVRYASDGTRHFLHIDGECYVVAGDSAAPGLRGGRSADRELRAPMPGLVTQIFVAEGQRVAGGEPLFVVEAMKMEHLVRAAAGGRVARIAVAAGTQVEGGAVVVEIEEQSQDPSPGEDPPGEP